MHGTCIRLLLRPLCTGVQLTQLTRGDCQSSLLQELDDFASMMLWKTGSSKFSPILEVPPDSQTSEPLCQLAICF